MRIAPFGMKEPKSCPTARIQLNVLTTGSEIIPLQANIIDYLTNELQVVETSNELQIQNLTNYWKKPDVLIGADYFFKFISLREIKELKSGHMLVQSKVGPMIAGSGDIEKLCKNELYPKEVVYSTNANINSELEKFWKLETIGIQKSPQDDDEALKHFKRTIIKQGGRYQNLINHLQHNSNLHLYHKILMDQLHSGIIEEVPPKDEVGVIHYLSHQEVLTPRKSTTELRIVYDASAHHKVGVILRFRMMKIVITADIEKAFLQLKLQNEERNCIRFLWSDDIDKELTNENIKCYRFKRVPFGVISLPFLLAATLNYHLENHGSELAWEIRKNLYVDNVIISANGTEEALYKYERTEEIFGEASMNIREFLSNDKKFNERIPECDLSQTNQEIFLGLKWNHERDIIRVALKLWIGKSLTKRTILQFIASQ
uniref:Uncharacterized protein n=1 Tax=Brugia malayi TaxID=6279 RepID=A8PPL2_BRUMA